MSQKEAEDIMQAIISASHTAYCLRNIKHLSHITAQREQNLLRKTITGLIQSLVPYEHQMEKIDAYEEEALEDVYNVFHEFLDEVSKIKLQECVELKDIIKKYNLEKL